MGGLLSRREDGKTYERILEKIDAQITEYELAQKSDFLKQRKIMSGLITYSILIEVVLIAWFYYHHTNPDLQNRIYYALPFVLFPIVVFLLRLVINVFFARRAVTRDATIIKLKSQLKLKLDERKKATDFESTQQLLSKYEKKFEEQPPQTPQKGKTQATPKATPGPQATPAKIPSTPSAPITPISPNPAYGNQHTPTRAPRTPGHPQQQQQQQHVQQQFPPQPQPEAPKGWMDKLVDYLVGTGPQYGFALICANCKVHNGLAPGSEMKDIQFRCRACNCFNQVGTNGLIVASSPLIPRIPPQAATPSPQNSSANVPPPRVVLDDAPN